MRSAATVLHVGLDPGGHEEGVLILGADARVELWNAGLTKVVCHGADCGADC